MSAPAMEVIQLPMWQDNYAYLIVEKASGLAALVDAPEAGPVLETLKEKGLTLQAIWNTHHHFDHVGANKELLKHFPALEVAASDTDGQRVPGFNHAVKAGDTLVLGQLRFEARAVPGHTLGHMAWVGHGAAFVGDTLFALGCGRLFEGTPQQMHHSLTTVLGNLPGDTRVYCAHEYTLSNLAFAMDLLPNDNALAQAGETLKALREKGTPTVPTTLDFERRHNPFLRCHETAVAQAVAAKSKKECPGEVAVFATLRALKDQF